MRSPSPVSFASSEEEEEDTIPEPHASGEEEEEEEEEEGGLATVWQRGPSRLPDRPIPLEHRPVLRPDGKR